MKKFNPIWLFIAFAAIAQGVMWVNLFSLIHDGILVYIGGIPAGLAIVGLIVYSANLLPRVQSARARRGGWVMLVLTMIAEPIVLGVVNWWFMPADFRLTLGSYIVAGGASLIVSFVLVLGALVDRSLVPAEKSQATQKPAEQPAQIRSAKKKSAQKSLSEIPCRYAGAGCDRTFAKQNAANAHARSCGFKPTIAMPVDVSQKAGKP
jgi:hypothetical protein